MHLKSYWLPVIDSAAFLCSYASTVANYRIRMCCTKYKYTLWCREKGFRGAKDQGPYTERIDL